MSSCVKPKRFRKNLNFTQKFFKKRKTSKKRTQQQNDDLNNNDSYYLSCKRHIKNRNLLATSDSYYTPKCTLTGDFNDCDIVPRGNS
jgi:hypothetical protein